MSENVIHIVVDEITPRMEFVFDFMFNQVLQTNYVLHLPNQQNIPIDSVFYYSINHSTNALCIIAHPLLFNTGNEKIDLKTTKYQSFSYPFATANNSLLPFDPFAAAFYFLSQYEEQCENFPSDHHSRFKANQSSIAPYIHYPMVDMVCKILKMKLVENGFRFANQSNRYSFTPTFDIDVAYAHKAKSLKRHFLGTAKLALHMKHKELIERFKVWMKIKNDPYDIFDLLLDLFEELQIKALFFALIAKNGEYDHNNSAHSTLYQNLIRRLNKKQKVYLHSSYGCMDNNELLQHEKQTLEAILKTELSANRQHFLRFRLPEYWKLLIENNIFDDYSQGFYDTWGYRCGTSFSHQAFDIKRNQVLPITIHPFIFMDTALIKEYKNDVVLVHEKMIEIVTEAKSLGVPCIGVWHNYAMPHDSLYLDNFVDVLKFAYL
jgi:hypothetical protein